MIEFALNQSITNICRETQSGWGDVTYAIIYQNIPCKFSYSISRVLAPGSEAEGVVAICYIDSRCNVYEDDRILFNNIYYLIYKVERMYDIFGNILGYRLLLKER